MTTWCAQSLDRYNWMDDRYDYSYDMYECLGDTYIYVMTSHDDTNLCDRINTPSHILWRAETCFSFCVPSGGTFTSSFYDNQVDGVS